MGRHALELREAHRAGVDVEAAGTGTEGLDRCQYLQRVDDVEVHEADAARAVRGQLLLGGPAVHVAPVVQHHVVDAVGHDRAAVAHLVDVRVEDGEHATGDLVRRAFRDAAVAVDRTRIELRHHEAASGKTGAADEDAAAANRCAFAARRQSDQVGADGHALVRLHVPQRERPLQNVDAEADRPVGIRTRVRAHDVQAVDVDMAALHGVSRQELYLPGDSEVGQPHAPQAGDCRVVEDGALVGRRRQLQSADFVVGAELQAVDAIGKLDRCQGAFPVQRLPGCETEGRRILQRAAHDDPADRRVQRRRDQGIDRLGKLVCRAGIGHGAFLACTSVDAGA